MADWRDSAKGKRQPLYTAAERARRDASPWTVVQGVLAPLQFLAFLISLSLVMRFLMTGEGEAAADISVVIKTILLLAIMVTGSIWEKKVFGVWLFARPFFWEDVISFAVIALHLSYMSMLLLLGVGGPDARFMVALAGYAAYVVNATQFLLKLRAARRDEAADLVGAAA